MSEHAGDTGPPRDPRLHATAQSLYLHDHEAAPFILCASRPDPLDVPENGVSAMLREESERRMAAMASREEEEEMEGRAAKQKWVRISNEVEEKR